MYTKLVGKWVYKSGTEAATVTLPKGSRLLQVIAKGGTVVIFGGDTITLPTDLTRIPFLHDLATSGEVDTSQTATIVFGGSTTFYFVEYVEPR